MIEKRMEQRGQGGFTLIELLVVIAILAVLGGAVIIGIGAMRGNAEKQVCKTNKETIELAAEAYKVAETTNGVIPGANDAERIQELIDKEYLKAGTITPANWSLTAAGVVTGQTEYPDLGASGETLCEA